MLRPRVWVAALLLWLGLLPLDVFFPMMMIPRFLLLLIFGWMLGAPGAAAARESFERIYRLWESGAVREVGAVFPLEYQKLDAEQRALLLPLLGTWLLLEAELAKHPDASWRQFKSEQEWTPFLNALPVDHPIRSHWALGQRAASILRAWAERGDVKDPSILPYLIEGIAHPASSTAGRDSFYTMTLLTKLYDGASIGKFDGVGDFQKIAQWFREWWRANSKLQVILTPELQQKMKLRFLAVNQAIESAAAAAGVGHPLQGYKSPGKGIYHRVGRPLFFFEWDGKERFASLLGQPRGEGWAFVCVRCQTPLLTTVKTWDADSLDMVTKIAKEAPMVYKESIIGTDWAVEVYVKNVSKEHMTALAAVLSAAKSAEQKASR
jgi:hypothetical protein